MLPACPVHSTEAGDGARKGAGRYHEAYSSPYESMESESMATVEPSASPNEIVRCAVCHGRITMPDFVILQGALMCYACEGLQAAETPGRLPEPS
jgi:hypothetical protein